MGKDFTTPGFHIWNLLDDLSDAEREEYYALPSEEKKKVVERLKKEKAERLRAAPKRRFSRAKRK